MCVCRLLSAFAEEQATADAIYYLGEALRRGVIDLDVFLKVNEPTQAPSYGETHFTQAPSHGETLSFTA